MRNWRTFFEPTSGKVLFTLGALLFLPVVYVRYAMNSIVACDPRTCPDVLTITEPIAPLTLVARHVAYGVSPKYLVLSATALYILFIGGAVYTLTCFFHEHRGKIHGGKT